MDKTAKIIVNETVEDAPKKTADKVIAIALEEEGYLEKSKKAYTKNHDVLDSKEDGAGSENYTKYGRDMHELSKDMDFAQPWCDCFVDWCFYKAYGEEDAKALLGGRFDDYTKNSVKLYKDMKAWHTSDPQVGDQIFFTDKSGKICHTGLVYKVAKGYVYTIEGNTSDAKGVVPNGGCVKAKSYSTNYNRIGGYGRPKYDVDPTAKRVDESKTWEKLIIALQKALNAEYDAHLVVDGQAGKQTLLATPDLNRSTRDKKPQTVTAVQNLLSYWGYKCLADGDFYCATEKQVRLFQGETVKLAHPDGEFWAAKKTWKVLLDIK